MPALEPGFDPTVGHQAPDPTSVLGLGAGRLGASSHSGWIAQFRVPGVDGVPLDAEKFAALPATLVWHPNRTSPVIQRLINLAR